MSYRRSDLRKLLAASGDGLFVAFAGDDRRVLASGS
jgi:hypothetical protein